MATKQELMNQVITYGIKNQKSKKDILLAAINSGQFDVVSAASALKAIETIDPDLFNYQQPGGKEPTGYKGLAPAQQTAVADFDSTIQSSQEAKSLLEKVNTGPIAGRVQRLRQETTGGATPEFTELNSKLSQVKSNFMKALAGANVTASEAKRLVQFLPDVTDPEETIKVKLDNFTEELARQRESLMSATGATGRGLDISGKQETGQAQPGFAEAMDFARKNPNDPNAIKLRDAIKSGRIDPITGEKIQPEQVSQEQKPTEISNDNGLISRLWSATKEVIPEIGEDVGKRLKNIWSNISSQQETAKSGSVFENVLKGQETNLRNLGEVGGAVGDIATRALELSYKAGVPKETQDKIKQTANEFMQTPSGQTAMSALQGGVEKWDEFKKSNPNIAKDMEAAFNIVTAAPLLKGAGALKSGLKSTIKKTTSGISEKVSGVLEKRAIEKSSQEALDVTSKNLSKKQAINVLEESGQTEKGAVEKGIFKKVSPVATKQDQAVAESVTGLVKKDASAATNSASINKEISRISEDEIKPFLENNNAIFNKKTLNSRLKSIEIPDYIKTDKALENTYNLVRQRMIEIVNKSPKNMSGLWEARKKFDRVVKEQFGDAVFEKKTVASKALKDMRTELNNFISEKTPNGDELFKGKLSKLSNMYEARHRIAESGYKELGGNRISRWAKRNPKKTKAIKYGVGAYAGSKIYQGLSD